jgi:hypothetical protein
MFAIEVDISSPALRLDGGSGLNLQLGNLST